jgi:7-cyano-7-deazaguanine synthase in queuosine biosynthesis
VSIIVDNKNQSKDFPWWVWTTYHVTTNQILMQMDQVWGVGNKWKKNMQKGWCCHGEMALPCHCRRLRCARCHYCSQNFTPFSLSTRIYVK